MSILVLVYTICYECLSNEIDFVVKATQILSSTIQGLRLGRDLSTLDIFGRVNFIFLAILLVGS